MIAPPAWWPWHRHPPRASADAQAAVAHARRASEDAAALGRRVDFATEQLAATRSRNHFAVAVEQSMNNKRT